MSGHPRSQRGAVLIIGLLVLLVMTVLGIASISDTMLQERMASNSRQMQVGMESAESALREAEAWLATQSPVQDTFLVRFATGAVGDLHLYSMVAPPGEREPPDAFAANNPATWDDTNSIQVVTPVKGVDGDLDNQPRYVVEYLGRIGPPPLDPNSEDLDLRTHAFRITALGYGADEGARYVLRSHYRVN